MPRQSHLLVYGLDRVEPGRRRWRWNPERRTVVATLIVPPAPGAYRSRARRRQMSRKIRCPQFLPSVRTCSSSNHSYACAQSQAAGSSARRVWFGGGRRRRLSGVLSGPCIHEHAVDGLRAKAGNHQQDESSNKTQRVAMSERRKRQETCGKRDRNRERNVEKDVNHDRQDKNDDHIHCRCSLSRCSSSLSDLTSYAWHRLSLWIDS